MMSIGKFRADLGDVRDLLSGLELVQAYNAHVNYQSVDVARLRLLPYASAWRLCIERRWYDLMLTDGSLLQFQPVLKPDGRAAKIAEMHLRFVHCPFNILPYREFLREFMGVEYAVVRESFWHQYESYVDQCEPNPFPSALRYDYEPGLYAPGLHPASHVHVGHGTNVRLGCARILGPFAFASFVLRQVYPDQWKLALARRDLGEFVQRVRHALLPIAIEHRCDSDRAEMYLE